MRKILAYLLLLSVLVTLSACAGVTRRELSAGRGAMIGASVGAILGQAMGHDTESTLMGAGIGAALGGITGDQIGRYMDGQELALRSALVSSDAADIHRSRDTLVASFKSEFLFDFDSYRLKPGAYVELDRVATVLSRYPQTVIRIEGHTDSIGSEAYNLELSEKRAEAVKVAFMQKGIPSVRIEANGYGESQPISSNHALNRRVLVVIAPTPTS